MIVEDEQPELPRVLYLGPLGTYTHQVAHENLGDHVAYAQRDTIRDIFDSISPEFPYGVVPQENSTYGSVVDTYDFLRLPKAGSHAFVRGEVTLSVQHCLVVRKGVQRDDIKRILSHEQALGQCRDYLHTNFPEAIPKKVSSTAAAATALIEDEDVGSDSAAICSAHCASLFEGLEVLDNSIQDKQDNYTRFFVLSQSLEDSPPLLDAKPRLLRALIRINMPSIQGSSPDAASSDTASVQGPAAYSHNRPLHLIVSTLLTTFGVPVIRIDRRPSLSDVPFEDLYFIELEELGSPLEILSHKDRLESWTTRVTSGVKRVKAAGSEATLLGVW